MKYVVKLHLKEVLKERGMTQKRLAELTGIRESSIGSLVRGTRKVINFDDIRKIMDALRINDIRKILEVEGQKSDVGHECDPSDHST